MLLPRSPFTLIQLRTFEAVVRRSSFTRAAGALNITQPAVSLQLKQLAASVGMPIIEVVGRKVFATEAGEALLATTNTLFDTWNEFEATIAELRGLKKGRLRLAAVTTAEYFIPRMLGPFAARYPGIEILLAVDNRNKVVERLAANADDISIMGMPPESFDLQLAPFLANPLVVIAPRKHPLTRRTVTLPALANERFLMREAGSGTRMATERFFHDRAFTPNIVMELGSNEAIKGAVAANLGIAVVSRHALEKQAAHDGIAVLDVRGFPIERSWYLVHQRGRALSAAGRAFWAYAVGLRQARGKAQN